MFINLKTVLNKKGISLRQYARFLGVSEKTVQNKLNGVTEFTYPEFRKTCILLFPEYNADFLFSETLSLPPASQPHWLKATIVKEAIDILKRLSPENQAYFMTLVRIAEAAEKGARASTEKHLCESAAPNSES